MSILVKKYRWRRSRHFGKFVAMLGKTRKAMIGCSVAPYHYICFYLFFLQNFAHLSMNSLWDLLCMALL